MSISTPPTNDLTRWNRAGLSRLHYTDGNAATYLEDLRLALRNQFGSNEDVLVWLGENLTDKNLREWQARLLDQYDAPRRDYAWEILRTFARSSHVLAQTVNAYSNERYIRTATQWDNLRRLVKMLDYHPAPPASAETWVALLAKLPDATKGITGIGTVDKGLALQNQPKDGSSPLVFETLQELDVDYRINELRAPDYDRSVESLAIPAQNTSFNYPLRLMPEGISVGDRGVVSCLSQAAAVEVKSINAGSIDLKVIEQGFTARNWALADVRLLLTPAWQNAPRLNGSNVVEVSSVNNSVRTDDLLAYVSGSNWVTTKVVAVDGNRVQFGSSVADNTVLYQTLEAKQQGSKFVIPSQRGNALVWKANLTTADPDPHREHEVVIYDYLAANTSTNIYYLPANPPAAFSVINAAPAALQFAGKPGDLVSGDWIILQNTSGHFYTRTIASIDLLDGAYRLTVNGSLASGSWVLAQGHFKQSLPALAYDENHESIYHDSTDTHSQLTLSLSEFPPAFTIGRALWVVGAVDRRLVTVQEILRFANNTLLISVKPSLGGLDLPKYATRVYANVIKAGHGETRGQSVLGSGNRIESNQEFLFAKTGVAFEQDNNFASGVRASVTVQVDDRVWTQVDSLRDSESTDTHFETTLNEDHQLLVRFGDGIHGQRLPTGTNNLILQARFGVGIEGNLPAASLNKLKKPHPLVESVIQPEAATGGGDLETGESLRELAPASVLTLERAVSIADYGHIAQRHASIWQARSYALPDTPRATDRVEVVLVPAGGGALSPDFKTNMKTYLEGFSRPGVWVHIEGYQAILLDLRIKLRVDINAYDGDKIAELVRVSLLDSFSLQKAVLAEPLYLSRVYQVVEAVEGVENVDVFINPDGFVDENLSGTVPADVFYGDDNTLRRLTPGNRQLIYLNADLIAPNINWEAADV
ncbi:MAG: baseplate J/gp47 family protein [Cellvibrio sp.]